MTPHSIVCLNHFNETTADILTDVMFEFAGNKFLIRRRVTPVTYRITDLETEDGYLYRCTMTGNDGSIIPFYLTLDDIRANMLFAEAKAELLHSLHIT